MSCPFTNAGKVWFLPAFDIFAVSAQHKTSPMPVLAATYQATIHASYRTWCRTSVELRSSVYAVRHSSRLGHDLGMTLSLPAYAEVA